MLPSRSDLLSMHHDAGKDAHMTMLLAQELHRRVHSFHKLSELPRSDAQDAQPQVSATADAQLAQPPTAAATQQQQNVPDHAPSSYHGEAAQLELRATAGAPVVHPLVAAAPQESQKWFRIIA